LRKDEVNDYLCEDWDEAFPEQALDAEVRQRLSGFKGSMRDKIRKYVSEE
jgi:hypothetical protein